MNRVEFHLTDEELSRLDSVASQVAERLAPHHAAVASHEFSRKAAFLRLLEVYEEHQAAGRAIKRANAQD